jgi:hypothetical protein
MNYSYDFENYLIQQGGATFVYDGDGNRVEKIAGGVTTKYLVSEVNPTGYPQVVYESFSGGTGARDGRPFPGPRLLRCALLPSNSTAPITSIRCNSIRS